VRALYTLLWYVAVPVLLLRLWWRGRAEPGYRSGVAQRFGAYDIERPAQVIWVHAVSVGEARAAEPLVRRLASLLPDHRVLLTCTTAAGREAIRTIYGETVLATYLPYDLPGPVRRFVEHFRPRLAVLMETEVWPNLIAACASHAVPVVLANARLSESSASGYRRWRGLTRPAFQALTAVCAQSEADAQRLRTVGASAVQVTGNLKFDATLDAAQLEAGRAWRSEVGRPVVLLASTRDGEERMLLEHREGEALVVVVPRHARRFDEVSALAQSRRSQAPRPSPADRVHLGDTMGEMAFYYGACDVAVIGGSFQPLGGQNLIEALAAGAPVVLGPHMFNFAEATRLAVLAGAAVQTGDAAGAMREAFQLLEDETRRRRMSQAGTALCSAHRGATQRHLAVCKAVLGL
jgi:3-deoxy-D-manno-octulosonic-acid transferase